MPQALGSKAQISYVQETTFGTTPASPSMKLLRAAVEGESLGGNIQEVISNTINSDRKKAAARGGNIDVGGSIPFELPLLGIGTILKNLIGSVATTGAGPYTHTISVAALPAGLTVEKGFTDISQYFVFTGCKLPSATLNIGTEGLVNGTLDVLGQDEAVSGSTLGSPTIPVHTPFVHHQCTVQEGGSSANLLNTSFQINNNIDAGVRFIGSRNRGSLPEGDVDITGSVALAFENITTYNKWLNETETTLNFNFADGSNSVVFNFTQVKFFGEATPKIATKQGLVVPLNFRALDMTCTIVNSEATI